MRRFACVSFVVFLLFGVSASAAHAQDVGAATSGRPTSGFELEQNYPNPFNPETTIPFTLGEGLFADGRPVTVSIVIFNLLQQQVAVPLALRHPAGDIEVRQLEYQTPGYHEAFWNGLDGAGNQVASGVYFVRLTVNGQSQFKRMLVTK